MTSSETWPQRSRPSSFDSLPYPFRPDSSPPSLDALVVPTRTLDARPGLGIQRARSSGALEFDPRDPSCSAPQLEHSSSSGMRVDDHDYHSYYHRRRPSALAYLVATDVDPAATSSPSSHASPPNPRKFHRRTSSAQPAFFFGAGSGGGGSVGPGSTPMNSVASGSDASSRRTSATSYAWSTSPAWYDGVQRDPSDADLDKFLDEMKVMLGPDAVSRFDEASVATTPATTRTSSSALAAGLTLTSTSSPPASPCPVTTATSDGRPRGRGQTYNVSGVILTEDEYRQYTRSERAQEQSAYGQDGSDRRQRFASVSRLGEHEHSWSSRSPAYFAATGGYELDRPRSAPPSPQVDPSATFANPFHYSPSTTSTVHYGYPPSSESFASVNGGPCLASAPHNYSTAGGPPVRPFHRRGSSVDAAIPRTFVTEPSIPAYGYASFPTMATLPRPLPTRVVAAPSTRSNLPVGYPPPYLDRSEVYSTPPRGPKRHRIDERFDERPYRPHVYSSSPSSRDSAAMYSSPSMTTVSPCSSAGAGRMNTMVWDDQFGPGPISPLRSRHRPAADADLADFYDYDDDVDGHCEDNAAVHDESARPVGRPRQTRDASDGKKPLKSAHASATTPTRARGGVKSKGHESKQRIKCNKAPAGISFINFSASDANVLLSGVAPSGSSKKRQRVSGGEEGPGGGGARGGQASEGDSKPGSSPE